MKFIGHTKYCGFIDLMYRKIKKICKTVYKKSKMCVKRTKKLLFFQKTYVKIDIVV